MPAFAASAPGKVILFGEHAVVYGRPAIAAPVTQVQARVVASANPSGPAGQVFIDAPDIDLQSDAAALPDAHPLVVLLENIRLRLSASRLPAMRLRITSSIPLASGLGSGAAVSVALTRAVCGLLGRPLSDEDVSAIAYEVEKVYHGTPSGIDNTVVAYARPVYFQRGQPIEILRTPTPFTLVIGDSGIQSPTAAVVGDVRRNWQQAPGHYEALFDTIARITAHARELIERGTLDGLGALMDVNHQALQETGVSCPELDRLVTAALQAGAGGAKLSGAGRGGNMLALAEAHRASRVAEALAEAGAVRTLITTIQPPAGKRN